MTNIVKKERVYIAGPMRGYKNFNFPAFDEARDLLNALGYHAISPADIDREKDNFNAEGCTGFEENWSSSTLHDIIMRDVVAVLDCDSIYLLNGWEESTGAKAEKAIAKWSKKNIYFEETGL